MVSTLSGLPKTNKVKTKLDIQKTCLCYKYVFYFIVLVVTAYKLDRLLKTNILSTKSGYICRRKIAFFKMDLNDEIVL